MDDFETAKQFFIEGLQLLEAKNYQAAEIQFTRSLEIISDRVSTLNNLSAIKIKLKKFAEAEEFALKAIALEDKSAEAWSNLGIALAATERHEEALRAYDRALDCNFSYASAWLNKATTLLEVKRYDEALLACDQALKWDSSKYEVLYAKSLILKELKRPDEAQKIHLKSLEMRVASSPVFIAERRATQKGDVLIISQNSDIGASLKSFETLHLHCLNFPAQLAGIFKEDFHFTYVFEGNATRPSARKQIPQPDCVLNNCANGECVLSEGKLWGLIALVDSFGVPVVNHPTKVIQTTRDESAKLLDDIPGVLAPKTMRFFSVGKTVEELAREIEDQYDYPLITRTLISQEGKGMTRVDSRDALVAVLSSDFPEKFFVTEFVDSRGGDEFFRKIRAVIVKDEMIITRVDYDTDWNVRGRKPDMRVAFYLEHACLLDEEKRICKDPEAGLGRSAIQSLRAIRDRIPLDVFGIDFDVDKDGRVVFYEANATMNLFSTAREEVPYPKESDDCLKQAFQRYLTSLVARR
jgi:Flp pilus assembly protein TadD/glutathione synthase/RimK-type ligase-like ATP-grasp enzyme